MTSISEHLTCLAGRLDGVEDVTAEADTHYIGLTLPEKTAEELIKEGLVYEDEFEEEDENE